MCWYMNINFSNESVKLLKQAHQSFTIFKWMTHYAEIIRESITTQRLGSRDFWRIANSVLNRNQSTIPTLFHGPEVLSSPIDKANIFANCFAANSTLCDQGHPLPDCQSRTNCRISFVSITPRKVAKVIQGLDTSKATGPDQIPAIVLKMCSPELSPVLSKLYNLCLSKSVFPSSWKMASVVPVFKGSGEKSDPANYRPISLLPIISKVFESVINQHLLGFLEDHSLLTDAQFGFRHSRSTGDVLALITEHINKALDSRGEARVVALDISKAFDKVWHRGLVHKLKSYGISGKLLGTISDFLADRHITVVHEGHSSLTHSINAGVPQGSVLGPTLFLLYINDLPDRILSELAIYADDTTLFTAYRGFLSTSRSQASSTLNQDLTNVVAWGKDWPPLIRRNLICCPYLALELQLYLTFVWTLYNYRNFLVSAFLDWILLPTSAGINTSLI